MKFTAELESSGKNTAGFEVPADVVEALGGGGHPKVSVTVNGYTFRTSIARMGGRFLLGVRAERRTAADVAPGQVLDVEVDVPEEFVAALAADATAKEFWETLSYSKQQWHVLQVTTAKTDATRDRRIERSIGMLREGKAR